MNAVINAVLVVLLAITLAGCSILPTIPQELQQTVQAQAAVELKDVPFFAQAEFYCGPSSLAMVLNHAGENTSPEKLATRVYLPNRQGSLQIEMLAAPRQLGYLSYPIEPTLSNLFEALNAGSPVVVLLNLSLQIAPQWHYAVVIGYDPGKNNVILRSGSKNRELIPVATFLKLWGRAKNWGFTIIGPDQKIPGYVNAQAYLNAAVALERASPLKARQAYQQGVKTWPTEPWFHFSLGNLAYNANQFTEAKRHYQKAVDADPNMADAWNNLAETLIKLGQSNEARAAINKAMAIGGPRMATYKETAGRVWGR